MTNSRMLSQYNPTGDGVVGPEVHRALTNIGGRYAVYQNQLIGSDTFGAIKLVRFGGPAFTFVTADDLPDSRPDKGYAGWAYLLVGELDIENNAIKELV